MVDGWCVGAWRATPVGSVPLHRMCPVCWRDGGLNPVAPPLMNLFLYVHLLHLRTPPSPSPNTVSLNLPFRLRPNTPGRCSGRPAGGKLSDLLQNLSGGIFFLCKCKFNYWDEFWTTETNRKTQWPFHYITHIQEIKKLLIFNLIWLFTGSFMVNFKLLVASSQTHMSTVVLPRTLWPE